MAAMNKAQLRGLPPAVLLPPLAVVKVTRPGSIDSSGDANIADRSLSAQPPDSRAPSSSPEPEPDTEISVGTPETGNPRQQVASGCLS